METTRGLRHWGGHVGVGIAVSSATNRLTINSDFCLCFIFRAHVTQLTMPPYSPGADGQGNEVYGGAEKSVGIFLHRSGDDAIVKGDQKSLRYIDQALILRESRCRLDTCLYFQVFPHMTRCANGITRWVSRCTFPDEAQGQRTDLARLSFAI